MAELPRTEWVEATVWYRYSGIMGMDILKVEMPYREWMSGTILLDALIEAFDKQVKGKFLRGMKVKDFTNKDGLHEFIMVGDPRTGTRYWAFEK